MALASSVPIKQAAFETDAVALWGGESETAVAPTTARSFARNSRKSKIRVKAVSINPAYRLLGSLHLGQDAVSRHLPL
jgi:hypothetical protein